MTASAPNILYLVHDLADPAVARRIAMLRDGGARVSVAGFRRTAESVPAVSGCTAIDLGRTYNGGFPQRILSVLRETLLLGRHRKLFTGADIVIARNLEMLALAVRGRGLCTDTPPALVYESLDIHRLLLNRGMAGSALRALEGWLSRRASGLIVSAPAFVSGYFDALSRVALPVRLVENKVYPPPAAGQLAAPRPAGPPWRVGWFGAIRCAKSFSILSNLAARSDGAIEVVIRGRPAYDQIPDFDRAVAQAPGLRFEGPYKNPDDLAAIYGEVHFTWAIDMFEEGLNSSWLLPNRLYEGGLYGAIPLARENVETGRFIRDLGIGVTLADPLEDALEAFFTALTPGGYADLAAASAAVPVSAWICTGADCRDLVAWLAGLCDKRAEERRAA